MAAFDIIFRCDSVIGYPLLIERVDRVSLLQECIADVLLIGQDLFNVALVPFCISRAVQNAVFLKPLFDLEETRPVHVLGINASYDFRFFRNNDQLAVIILCVPEESVMIDPHLTCLIPKLNAKPDVC